MQNPTASVIARIKQLAGLTDKQLDALMPNGPHSVDHHVGGISQGVADKRSRAEQEHAKDTEGWEHV